MDRIRKYCGGALLELVFFSVAPIYYYRIHIDILGGIIIIFGITDENGILFIHLKNEDSRLAFGKKAQNVRLAQILINRKIKFIIDDAENAPTETFEEKKERVARELAASLGIGEDPARILVNNGYLTIEGLRVAGIQDIAAIKGLDDTSIVAISKAIGNTEGE